MKIRPLAGKPAEPSMLVNVTDKDGIAPALLAAEMTAKTGADPGEIYRELIGEFGEPANAAAGSRSRN